MAHPRLCVSIPVHEQPAVVLDQIENLRTFLPADTVVVLHVSQSFPVSSEFAGEVAPGVYANPRRQQTAWGNTISWHDDNFRYASLVEAFDVFVMHASNDLYVRSGAERHVATAPAGVFAFDIGDGAGWWVGEAARRDPALACICAELGGAPLVGSQAEGTWFARDVFAEIVERIERHWRPGEGEHYAREELYYPTVGAALVADRAAPLVYSDAAYGKPLEPSTIEAIAGGGLPPALAGPYDPAGLHAVKRIPRVLDDPLRVLVRDLAERERELGTSTRGFVVVAFSEELVDDPSLLAADPPSFDADDDVSLVVLSDGRREEELVAAVRGAGLDADGTADVLVVSSAQEPAYLRRAGAVLSERHEEPLPRFGAAGLPSLRALVDGGGITAARG